MFLTPQDFTGKYELHTGLYDQSKLNAYIEKYEKRYLIELFGATLYDDFVSDLDLNQPLSPNFQKVFFDFHENVSIHQLLISEGILEMLKGFVYFEYSKDQMNQQTPFGNVSQLSENSKKVTTLNSMMFTRYNEAVKSYGSIRAYMILNSSLKIGQLVTIAQQSFGSGYLTANNVQLNEIGQTSNMTLNQIGSGYVDAFGCPTIGGNGTGLTVNIIENGSGGVQSFTIANSGSGYAVDDIITIAVGNGDATLIITDVINSSIGAGASVDITANGIDGCGNLSLATSGTGYVDEENVQVTGGTGSGLLVDITVDGSGGVQSIIVKDTGQAYSIGDTITIASGNADATFDILTLTDGQITSISLNQIGFDYVNGQEFVIKGGDNNCLITVVKVGIGDFRKYNGVHKSTAYWI